MELLKVDSLEAAREKLFRCAADWEMDTETLPFEKAAGRVLAEDLYAPLDVPGFVRSTVDGYALCSADTAAAGDSIPVYLSLAGQVEMGEETALSIVSGQCVEMPTGGMLPAGADAVVMLEYCESFGKDGVAVGAGVAPGENTVIVGEDVQKGDALLSRGTLLRPRHIGALAAAGITDVRVYRPLRLTIISTGDELRPTRVPLSGGEIYDVNSHVLRALAQERGYSVADTLLLPDDEDGILSAVTQAKTDSDAVIISGGSSKGKKDATCKIIDAASCPGVFTHGLAMKPGKPTILGYDAESRTLMGGMPGHPTAAMMVFELLFSDLCRKLTGQREPIPVTAQLSVNVAGSPGKLTCQPVRLEPATGGFEAVPVYGKSGLITTLRSADGYIMLDRNCEGLNAGETVKVNLF